MVEAETKRRDKHSRQRSADSKLHNVTQHQLCSIPPKRLNTPAAGTAIGCDVAGAMCRVVSPVQEVEGVECAEADESAVADSQHENENERGNTISKRVLVSHDGGEKRQRAAARVTVDEIANEARRKRCASDVVANDTASATHSSSAQIAGSNSTGAGARVGGDGVGRCGKVECVTCVLEADEGQRKKRTGKQLKSEN